MIEKIEENSDRLIKEFAKMDTPSVSDALDRLAIRGGLEGIKPVVSGLSMCGRAFTVHYVPCGVVKGTVGDFLDDVRPGQVVVIDNGGRTYCTVWGDLMTLTATRMKIAGTVIDGVCRDVPKIKSLSYPIFTKGCFMVTGKDRVEVDFINKPISIAEVQVKPGDLILADDSGALVVPWERAAEVLKVAQEIAAKEEAIEEAIESGKTLREARASVNYHHLQTFQG
jgi:regulator of RNase E activity RraA